MQHKLKILTLILAVSFLLCACNKKVEIKEAKAIPDFDSVQFREDNSNTLDVNLSQFIGGNYYVKYIFTIPMNEQKNQIIEETIGGYTQICLYQMDQVLASSFDENTTLFNSVAMKDDNQIQMNFDIYFEYNNTVLNYEGFILIQLHRNETYIEAEIINTHFKNRKEKPLERETL